ncbi:hypothetical protein NEUTE2DRAFT_50048 [Neurospora tetrasperma FGSC 2509]|nr:hypothetical protein NEUTE2DRAFT_50048 [Neurospora tetrasperma FGSC 2509]
MSVMKFSFLIPRFLRHIPGKIPHADLVVLARRYGGDAQELLEEVEREFSAFCGKCKSHIQRQ